MSIALPNKLSALLRLAVSDAQKCETDPRVKLDMYRWHEPQIEGERSVCSVCMAGAVMHCSLDADATKDLLPHELNGGAALLAINSLRTGSLGAAAKCLGLDVTAEQAAVYYGIVAGVINDALGRAPWDVYLKAADYLEEQGL